MITYGPPGSGKTIDSLYSFLDCAVFVYREGSIVGENSVIGRPARVKCMVRRWSDLFGVVQAAAAQGCKYVVVDDATLLWTLGEWPVLEALYGIRDKNDRPVGMDRAMWTAAKGLLTQGALEFTRHGVLVVLNAHEQPPDDEKGIKGGPDFGWAKLVSLFPHIAQTLVRTGTLKPSLVAEPIPIGGITPPPAPAAPSPVRGAWDTIGHCDPWDTKWYMKDRYATAFPYGPLNTAELLRAAGRIVPRPYGLEWMEEVAERAAVAMLNGQPQLEVTSEWRKRMSDKHIDDKLMIWALRDSIHRFRFRKNKADTMWNGL